MSNAINAKHTPLIVIHSLKLKAYFVSINFNRKRVVVAAETCLYVYMYISNKSKNFQLYAECGMHVFREGARTLLPGAFDRCLIKYIRVSVRHENNMETGAANSWDMGQRCGRLRGRRRRRRRRRRGGEWKKGRSTSGKGDGRRTGLCTTRDEYSPEFARCKCGKFRKCFRDQTKSRLELKKKIYKDTQCSKRNCKAFYCQSGVKKEKKKLT